MNARDTAYLGGFTLVSFLIDEAETNGQNSSTLNELLAKNPYPPIPKRSLLRNPQIGNRTLRRAWAHGAHWAFACLDTNTRAGKLAALRDNDSDRAL